MSLLLIEGFENNASNNTTAPVPGFTYNTPLHSTSYGRLGGTGIRCDDWFIYPVPVATTELIVGAAVYTYTLGSTQDYAVYFYHVNSLGNGCHSINVLANGAIVTRFAGGGGATIVAQSAPGIVQPNTWGYIEWRITNHDTTGKSIVRYNGIEVLNYTGDTRNGGIDNNIGLIYFRGGAFCYYDDVYILNPLSGSAPYNDFLGDVRVISLLPNSNGTYSQGTGSDSDSIDNYALVDESGAYSTADYVDIGIGEKDTYGYQNLPVPLNSTVYAVQTVSHLQKTDSGTINAATVAKLGGSETLGSAIVPATGPQWHRTIYEGKPGGGSWSVSDVNDAEFGMVAS